MSLPNARIARLPDGSLHVENDSGLSARLHGDSIDLRLPHLAEVTVEDPVDMLEHTITHCYGSTSHFIRLRDGGEVRLAYNDAGQLLELSAHRISVTIDPEGRMRFAPHRAP